MMQYPAVHTQPMNACVHAQLLYDHDVEAVQACSPACARLRLGMRATHMNLLACLCSTCKPCSGTMFIRNLHLDAGPAHGVRTGCDLRKQTCSHAFTVCATLRWQPSGPSPSLAAGAQAASAQAGAAAAALVQRCAMLARELRGTDLLAERARRLRRDVDKLEALVSRLLLS